MKKYNQKIGKLGEEITIKYLKDRGYDIVDKNVHFRCGEIDIIAEKDAVLFFVEVKTRTNEKFGGLEDSISNLKLERLEKSVEKYLIDKNIDNDCELLFVFVSIDLKNKKARVNFLEY